MSAVWMNAPSHGPIRRCTPAPRRTARPAQPAWGRWAWGLALAVAGSLAALVAPNALSQTEAGTDLTPDPPGRVARIGWAEGAVSTAEAGREDWAAAALNRPLTRGDRVWVAESSRSELHVGSTAVRLGSATQLNLLTLDDDVTQLQVTQGSVAVRVRQLFDTERFQIDTPQLAFSVGQPGEYRVDVDPVRQTTRVSVWSGSGAVYGDGGATQPLTAAQQITVSGSNLQAVALAGVGPRDGLQQWAAERDRLEDQSVSARFVSRQTIGYQQLDQHGDWLNDSTYGPVWYPRAVVADWAPYRYGHWAHVAPWGWTWVDDAPWGFAPFHYGRWAYLGNRWGWVPGPVVARPVYAPALVGFVGSPGVSVGFQIGGGPGVGWFPLGPGEAWRPHHRASPRYLSHFSPRGTHLTTASGYRYQRVPQAVTVVNIDVFRQSQPVSPHRVRPSPELMGRAEVVPAPAFGGGRDNTQRGPVSSTVVPGAAPPIAQRREPESDRRADPRQADDRRMDDRRANDRWPRRDTHLRDMDPRDAARDAAREAEAARQWRDNRPRYAAPPATQPPVPPSPTPLNPAPATPLAQPQPERTYVPPQPTYTPTPTAPATTQFAAPPNLIMNPSTPLPRDRYRDDLRQDPRQDPRLGTAPDPRPGFGRPPFGVPRAVPVEQPGMNAVQRADQAQREQAERLVQQQRAAAARSQADGLAQAQALAQARALAQAQAQAQQNAQRDSRPGSPLSPLGRKDRDNDDNRPPGRPFGAPR